MESYNTIYLSNLLIYVGSAQNNKRKGMFSMCYVLSENISVSKLPELP